MIWIFDKICLVTVLSTLLLSVFGIEDVPRSKHTDSIAALLSESLKNYGVQACEGQKVTLKCPTHTTIMVENTFFGRLEPSSQLCPPSEKQVRKKLQKIDANNKAIKTWDEDTSCHVTNAHTKVVQKCNNRRKCRLHTRSHFFGRDPCPTTSKYLQISYKCKPSQFNNGYYCEGGTMQLTCRPRKRIAVFSAVYGRSTGQVTIQDSSCQASQPLSYDCIVDVLPKIMRLCHAQNQCSLSINDDVLGNPCPKSVKKYLSLIFMCVSENIFNEAALEGRLEGLGLGSGEDPIDADKENVEEEEGVMVIETETLTQAKSDVEKPEKPKEAHLNNDAAFAPVYVTPSVLEDGDLSTASSVKRTTPATCLPPSVPNAVGFIHQWIATATYLRANKEKVILYFFLSASTGLILLLGICIAQQCLQRTAADQPPSKRFSSDHRDGSKIELESILNTPTVFDTESRVEMNDFGRNGISFMHFNHPTPPRTQQYYS